MPRPQHWRGKRVAVTGAGGFIGSHLVERLAGLGANVRAMVRYTSSSSHGWLDGGEFGGAVDIVAGDVASAESVDAVVEGVDVVFHLAANISIPYSYQSPRDFVRSNVEGTLNVLEAARGARCGRVVLTSTSEVYGTAQTVPMTEEHPLQAQSPYAASKIAADKLGESYHRSFGVPVVTVRPFNTYGPRQSLRAVVANIVVQALSGADRLQLGALHPTRDLVFVDDTVDGFLEVAEAEAAVGSVVQLGTGQETSIGDVARLVLAAVGREAVVVEDARRLRPAASEVERLVCDATRARVLAGWEAKVPLATGLARTIEWHRRRGPSSSSSRGTYRV